MNSRKKGKRDLSTELYVSKNIELPNPRTTLPIQYGTLLLHSVLEDMLKLMDMGEPTFHDSWDIVMAHLKVLSKLDRDGYARDTVEF